MGFRGMLLPEADPKETQMFTKHSQVPTCDLKVLKSLPAKPFCYMMHACVCVPE